MIEEKIENNDQIINMIDIQSENVITNNITNEFKV